MVRKKREFGNFMVVAYHTTDEIHHSERVVVSQLLYDDACKHADKLCDMTSLIYPVRYRVEPMKYKLKRGSMNAITYEHRR